MIRVRLTSIADELDELDRRRQIDTPEDELADRLLFAQPLNRYRIRRRARINAELASLRQRFAEERSQ